MTSAALLVVTLKTSFHFSHHETAVAVGVSGGGDSMALLHMVSQWAMQQGRQMTVHALTVDHGLRPESRAEAEQIGEWVKSWPCVKHHILQWDHANGKPQSSVMESARAARYALMNDYCRANHIQTLCIAHHADDQIETFLFRLAKGSGLDGLSGMDENVFFNDLRLYRPLLKQTHADLIHYCQANDIRWVEDPSNHNVSYARPRLRKTRAILEKEGLNGKRLQTTVTRLGRAAEALNHYTQLAYAETVAEYNNKAEIHWAALTKYHEEIIIRVMQKTLSAIGETQSGYPPKLERIETMVPQFLSGQLRGKSATLHGCVISLSKTGDNLEIVRS